MKILLQLKWKKQQQLITDGFVSNEIFTWMEKLCPKPITELLPVWSNAMKEGDEGLERAKLTDGNLWKVEST